MPYVHTESFHVRHYECDMRGDVHAANYLRYMQEAAFGASEAVGFPPERYQSLGLQWLAYETDMEYIQPLRFGDRFSIKTWVQDFRRVRSLRQYEFYREDQLVARAATDWVLLDVASVRPISITQEIIDAYSQGEDVPLAEPRRPLPPAKIPETGLFTIRRHARWHEIDGAGHVNNAVYLNYVEDCELQALAHYGHPLESLHADGVGLARRRHQLEYKLATTLDEEIEISTWIAALDETTIFRHFVVRRVADGALITRVRGLREWVDLESGQPQPIPAHYRAALEPNTVLRGGGG